LGGREVIVSGSWQGMVRTWDARTGQPAGHQLTGDPYELLAVAAGAVGGRELIVSGGHDGLRVWDASTGQPVGDDLTRHTSRVQAVALGSAGSRDVIVAGSQDKTVRILGYLSTDAVNVDDLGEVTALELTSHGILCVAAGPFLCTFAISR
jgi:WD40 repeat protein